MFVSFEGLDGSGKTTVINKLETYLKAHKITHLLTREPGTPHSEMARKIRNFIMSGKDVSPMIEALLFATDRRFHLEKVIWPALKQKQLVLCDRYFDSSFAYQGAARNLGMAKIITLNEIVTENTFPDLTIYFSLPYPEAIKRVQKRGADNRLDKETEDFVKRTHQGFEQLIKMYPQRYRVVDATQSEEQVFAAVKAIFEKEVLKTKS